MFLIFKFDQFVVKTSTYCFHLEVFILQNCTLQDPEPAFNLHINFSQTQADLGWIVIFVH